MTKKPKTEFIVLTKAACMPNSCWGRYKRVAVIEVILGTVPKMISERAIGVVRIVETWERLNVGKTAASAYGRALAEAHELRAQLATVAN